MQEIAGGLPGKQYPWAQALPLISRRSEAHRLEAMHKCGKMMIILGAASGLEDQEILSIRALPLTIYRRHERNQGENLGRSSRKRIRQETASGLPG